MAVGRTPGGQFTSFGGTGHLGYAVGNAEFLNSEASKVGRYWRQIEYGTEDHVGRFIGGLWSDSADRSEPLHVFEPGERGQQFVPFFHEMQTEQDAIKGALNALAYLVANDQLTVGLFFVFRKRLQEGDYRVPTIGVIKTAIVGQDAYMEAAASFSPAERELRVIDQVFGRMTYFTRTGYKRSVLADRTGRRSPTKKLTNPFVKRTGMITGHALSEGNRSLAGIDRQFQAELIQANKLLAAELAQAVVEIQTEKILRDATQTRALEEATLSSQNRFPS